MSQAPEDPGFYDNIVHGLTRYLRGANRGRGGRNVGCVLHRAGRPHGLVTDREDHTPSRPVVHVPVNRGGGSVNRKRPWKSTKVEESRSI